MADDPRKASWLDRLLRRQQETAPKVTAAPDPFSPEELDRAQEERRARARAKKSSPAQPATRPPAAKPVGQRRQQRRAPTAEFEIRSDSKRLKSELEFERRFKGEVARAEARLAMDDHAKIEAELQRQFIDKQRVWLDRLDRLTTSHLPTPEEAGADINRRGRLLIEQFDRDRAENDAVLRGALDRAAGLDLKIDLTRQKRLGYTPNRPRDFRQAATPPEPPAPGEASVARPDGPRTVLDHPFNEAATRPAAARPTAEHAFNDAVTAPDPLAAHFARFREAAPAPDPNRPGLAQTL